MDMIFKVETNKPFNVAVEALKESCAAVGFGVLWQLDFKDKLHEKGFEFDDDFMILEVCNPGKAQKVLQAQREMGFFLPCKVAVYNYKDQTFIGMPKPTQLIAVSGDAQLDALALEVEIQLKGAIEQAAN